MGKNVAFYIVTMNWHEMKKKGKLDKYFGGNRIKIVKIDNTLKYEYI